ncbi:uncharacterized protein LOC132552711, partial [Ylistrum balloti]|uniref:uncharacterized protein LOC132552711 n=1 Tax=Ylistrum balloti TaxID=509963 RepID=UPI002905DA8B
MNSQDSGVQKVRRETFSYKAITYYFQTCRHRMIKVDYTVSKGELLFVSRKMVNQLVNDQSTLSEAERNDVKEKFNHVDTDGSKFLNADELKRLLYLLKVSKTPSEMKTFMEQADKDKNGSLSYEEFLVVFEKQPKDDKTLRAAFDEIDTDGELSIDEFKQIMVHKGQYRLTEKEFKDLMTEMGAGGVIRSK